MSGSSVVLDTNAVLYVLDGNVPLIDFLDKRKIYLSFISELKLLSYSKNYVHRTFRRKKIHTGMPYYRYQSGDKTRGNISEKKV